MQFRVQCDPSQQLSQDINLIFHLQVLHSFPQIIKANMLATGATGYNKTRTSCTQLGLTLTW